MRLTRQSRRGGPLVLNMASMVDIVFLLLIFFMCTTSFTPPEDRLPAPLPRQGGVSLSGPEDDFEPIKIHVAGAGDLVVLRLNDAAAEGFPDLYRKLETLRAIHDTPVIIVAEDDAVSFKHCVKVLDLCARARFTKVAFRA